MKNSLLRLRRLNIDMDLDTVSKMLGIEKRRLYKIEEGHQKLTLQIAVKLSKIYKCSIEDICKDFGIDTEVNLDF
ncbi:helix-turn-helix transcriptional regulator [Clostridium perfringens]|nr:helix-turn-helix transcriptional regulator [Clostridium perfringens]